MQNYSFFIALSSILIYNGLHIVKELFFYNHENVGAGTNNPTIITSKDVEGIPVEEALVDQVRALLTPYELLQQEEFDLPEPIYPPRYRNFSVLKLHGNRIRELQLLPLKTDEEYTRYHEQSKLALIHQVKSYLQENDFALVPNTFPYFLPDDVKQYIIWMKDHDAQEENLAKFTAQSMNLLKVSSGEVILFERPLQTKSLLVKGTLPEIRHAHLWVKKSNSF